MSHAELSALLPWLPDRGPQGAVSRAARRRAEDQPGWAADLPAEIRDAWMGQRCQRIRASPSSLAKHWSATPHTCAISTKPACGTRRRWSTTCRPTSTLSSSWMRSCIPEPVLSAIGQFLLPGTQRFSVNGATYHVFLPGNPVSDSTRPAVCMPRHAVTLRASVVIPCFNERQTINELIDRVHAVPSRQRGHRRRRRLDGRHARPAAATRRASGATSSCTCATAQRRQGGRGAGGPQVCNRRRGHHPGRRPGVRPRATTRSCCGQSKLARRRSCTARGSSASTRRCISGTRWEIDFSR